MGDHTHFGGQPMLQKSQRVRAPLYTPEERRRRDASRWTLVQGVLAPLQFLVFLISATLVVRYLMTGNGLMAATVSVVIKTLVLYVMGLRENVWVDSVRLLIKVQAACRSAP